LTVYIYLYYGTFCKPQSRPVCDFPDLFVRGLHDKRM